MFGEHNGDIQFQYEPAEPGAPFVFSLAPEELEEVVRNSELAQLPQELSSAGEKNLYEQYDDLAGRLLKEKLSREVKLGAVPGELTGRNLIPQNGPVFQVDEKIGEGATAEAYLCHDSQKDKEKKIKRVIKVHLPQKGAPVEVIESEIEALKLHKNDDPPVVPKYFGDGTIDDRRAYVMELMRDSTLLERFKENGLYPIVKALNAITPFLDLLRTEEEQDRTASDFKTENIRVANDSKGEEYFRYLDYGLVPLEGVDRDNIRRAIARMAGFVYFTVIGRDPSPNSEEEMFSLSYWKLCMDMLKHQEFRSLPVGLQAVLMKGLGFLDGGYSTFTEFALDLALLNVSLATNRARTKLPDYRSSDLIGRAIAASVDITETPLPKKPAGLFQFRFRKQKIEPPVNKREQLAAEMEKMMSAARPPQVIESESNKRDRLIEWREKSAPSYVVGSIETRGSFPAMIADFDEYLSMFPGDPEMELGRDILEAIITINKAGIRKDRKFDDSYTNYLDSLTTNGDVWKELLPFDKLKELVKPLIELADKLKLMVGVPDSGEPPIEEVPESTLQELMDLFLANGLALDELKRKSANGRLTGLGSHFRQTALDFIEKAIAALDAMESRGVQFINIAGGKIPIGEIRARVEKDLKDLSGQ